MKNINIKATLAALVVFFIATFTFWYGGLDLFERSSDNAWALTYSMFVSVAVYTYPGFHKK
jgi:hypothetical protein